MTENSAPVEKPSSEELQSEVERLRAEKAALQAELDKSKKTGARHFPWRGVIVWVLIVLACIMALFAPIAIYVRSTYLNTDSFVSTVAPLIQEEEVATAVSNQAAQALVDGLRIEDRLKNALPEQLSFIVGPVSSGVEELTRRLTREVVTSDQFYWVWERALRLAHQTAVGIIEGDRAVEVSSQGEITLDVGELLTNVRDRLVQAGLSFLDKVPIPQRSRTIILFQSDQLGAIKQIVSLLNTLYWVLPFLALLFFAAAVVISRDRRRALMICGAGLAIVMAISLLAMNITKTQLLGNIQNQTRFAAAQVVWSDLIHNLVALSWGLFALGAVVASGSAVAGPYGWAVWLRRVTTKPFEKWRDRRQRGDKTTGPIGTFVNTHAWGFRIAGAIIAFVVLILFSKLTFGAVIWTAVILLIYLAVIELLRGRPPKAAGEVMADEAAMGSTSQEEEEVDPGDKP
jgi:hypothetical protein